MSDVKERKVIRRLRKAIGCPIHWEDHFDDECLCKDLRIYWAQLARNFETDGEMLFYSRRLIEYQLYESLLQSIEQNYLHWRENAVREYSKKTGFLLKMKFVSEKDQEKHYPNPAWSKVQIIQKTQKVNGDAPALFFKEFDPANLAYCLRWSIAQRLVRVIEDRPPHLYLKHIVEVGASMGKPTNYIRFDLDYDTPIAHGHPVLTSEVPLGADIIDGVQHVFSEAEYNEFDHDIDEPDDETITPRRDDPMP